MINKNETIRPPKIDKKLHKEIKIFAVRNDCSIQEAYEKLLKIGLEKRKESRDGG